MDTIILFGMFEIPVDPVQLIIAVGLLIIWLLLIVILKLALSHGISDSQFPISDALASDHDSHEFHRSDPEPAPERERTPPEPSPVQESEAQRLARIQKELDARHEREKNQRLSELREKERIIKSKEKGSQINSAPPKDNVELKKWEMEKSSIETLIKKAEMRYTSGELEDANFTRIVSDYQQRIIELDIKIRNEMQKTNY